MSDAVKYFQKNGFEASKQIVEMGFGFCSLEGGLSFHTEQLKEIVEAWEFTGRQGGLEILKAMEKSNRVSGNIDVADNFQQAIALVEHANESN